MTLALLLTQNCSVDQIRKGCPASFDNFGLYLFSSLPNSSIIHLICVGHSKHCSICHI